MAVALESREEEAAKRSAEEGEEEDPSPGAEVAGAAT